MALPVTDAFTNTNGVSLTTHNASYKMNTGAFQINTNALAPNSASAEIGGHWEGDTFNNDQYAKITLVAQVSTVYIGPAARCTVGTGTATYYGYYANGTDSYLFKNVAGTWTQIGSTGGAFAVNDVLELDVSGTTLTPKKNGATADIGAQTDSAIASGYGGITGFGASTSIRGDTFEAGNLTAAGLPLFFIELLTGQTQELTGGFQ